MWRDLYVNEKLRELEAEKRRHATDTTLSSGPLTLAEAAGMDGR